MVKIKWFRSDVGFRVCVLGFTVFGFCFVMLVLGFVIKGCCFIWIVF